MRYRTKRALLADFTSLFMSVVALRCDHSCPYCQVSRQSADRHAYDMSPETADHAVDFLFRGPSPAIQVESQSGESPLNFPIIRRVVERGEARNAAERRDDQSVVATNLAPLTAEILDFCRDHGVLIATGLDGPGDLRNRNRPRPGPGPGPHDDHRASLDR